MQPETNVDSNFSVYRIVKRTRGDHALLNHRRTMTIISNEIENATLLDDANTTIFAGFQRFSSFVPQRKRYERIAKKSQSVWVFGVPDVVLPTIPNIHYIPLKETDQLAKEWFVVSYGQDYFSALATEELTRWGTQDEKREFKGVWSFDLDLVSILYEWLERSVGHRGDVLQPHSKPHWERQLLRMNRTINRIRKRIKDSKDYRIIRRELEMMIDTSLFPALQTLIDEGLEPAKEI